MTSSKGTRRSAWVSAFRFFRVMGQLKLINTPHPDLKLWLAIKSFLRRHRVSL